MHHSKIPQSHVADLPTHNVAFQVSLSPHPIPVWQTRQPIMWHSKYPSVPILFLSGRLANLPCITPSIPQSPSYPHLADSPTHYVALQVSLRPHPIPVWQTHQPTMHHSKYSSVTILFMSGRLANQLCGTPSIPQSPSFSCLVDLPTHYVALQVSFSPHPIPVR